MAGLRDIKRRLVSVKNTKKITYAMKLVSAAKLRRAQESVTKSREYTTSLVRLIRDLTAQAGTIDFEHPLMAARPEVMNVGLLIIGGSRGLCGGYNTNVNRKIESAYKEIQVQYPRASVKAIAIGKKAAEYLRRVGKSYEISYEQLSEDANKWPIDEICFQAEQQFIRGEIDALYILFTHFKSALSMKVELQKLLPLESMEKTGEIAQVPPTIVEPSLRAVLMAAMARIMRSRVRQAGLDAKASEQASRMTAMDSATKNAGDIIRKLQLTYNKLRQAGITGELLDIIGGAEAIK